MVERGRSGQPEGQREHVRSLRGPQPVATVEGRPAHLRCLTLPRQVPLEVVRQRSEPRRHRLPAHRVGGGVGRGALGHHLEPGGATVCLEQPGELVGVTVRCGVLGALADPEHQHLVDLGLQAGPQGDLQCHAGRHSGLDVDEPVHVLTAQQVGGGEAGRGRGDGCVPRESWGEGEIPADGRRPGRGAVLALLGAQHDVPTVRQQPGPHRTGPVPGRGCAEPRLRAWALAVSNGVRRCVDDVERRGLLGYPRGPRRPQLPGQPQVHGLATLGVGRPGAPQPAPVGASQAHLLLGEVGLVPVGVQRVRVDAYPQLGRGAGVAVAAVEARGQADGEKSERDVCAQARHQVGTPRYLTPRHHAPPAWAGIRDAAGSSRR